MTIEERMEKRREHMKKLLLEKSKEEIVEITMFFAMLSSMQEAVLLKPLHYMILTTLANMLGEEAANRIRKFMSNAVDSALKAIPEPEDNPTPETVTKVPNPSAN